MNEYKYPYVSRCVYLVSRGDWDISSYDDLHMKLFYQNGYVYTPLYANTNNLPSVLIGHCEDIIAPTFVFVLNEIVVHKEIINDTDRFQYLITTLGFNCTRKEFEEHFYEHYFGKN